MIDLETPNDALMSEMMEEYERALYWFRRNHGGEKGTDRLQYDQEYRCLKNKENIVSDVVEYKGPHGNRWRIFMHTLYFPEANTYYTTLNAFIYYETYASCGAFVPTFAKDERGNKIYGCVIYTPHFFYRFCQRLGIQYRSSSMIQKFLEMVPSQVVQPRDEFLGKHRKCDIGLPGSIGRGVLRREGDSPIVEVKTFLTNVGLTPKQKKDTKRLREVQNILTFEPEEVGMELAKKMGLKDYVKHVVERVCATGVPKDIVESGLGITMASYMTITDGLGFDITDKDWVIKTINDALDCAYRCLNHDKDKDIQLSPFYDVVSHTALVAKVVGCKSFDLKKATRYLLDKYWDSPETEVPDTMEKDLETYAKVVEKFNGLYAIA